MIGVLDYGVGDVRVDPLYAPATGRTSDTDYRARSDGGERCLHPSRCRRVDDVVSRFDASGFALNLQRLVLVENRPLLGICVGMQMLARGSDEGNQPGLGWVPGQVRYLGDRVSPTMRLPAMGWYYAESVGDHDVVPTDGGPQRYYFVHSYFFECDDPADVAASVDYGTPITAAVQRGSITGTQFHPEKSHRFGMELLRRFAAKVPT